MDISFNCDKCGQSIEIDESGAGLQVECPKCGQSLTVPQAQPLPPKPPTDIPPVITKLPPVIAQATPTFRCKCGETIMDNEDGTGIPYWCPKCHRAFGRKLLRGHAAHNKCQVAQAKAEAGAAHAEWLAKDGSMFGFGAGMTKAEAIAEDERGADARNARRAEAEKRAAEVEPLNVLSSDGADEQGESENRTDRYIPDDVKDAVWRRDEGRCVKCKSNEKLEFDHIIPVSKGGSNTKRNVQLLCEKCNREKGAKIA